MPKASDIPSPSTGPVSVEDFHRERGLDPYQTGEERKPVEISPDADIPQFPAPSRFPDPEVIVEALVRGVRDRGFTFGVGPDGRWGTTWKRAEELRGQCKIVKVITPKPDADTASHD